MKKLLTLLVLATTLQAAPQSNPPLVRVVYIDYAPWHPCMKYLRWFWIAHFPH